MWWPLFHGILMSPHYHFITLIKFYFIIWIYQCVWTLNDGDGNLHFICDEAGHLQLRTNEDGRPHFRWGAMASSPWNDLSTTSLYQYIPTILHCYIAISVYCGFESWGWKSRIENVIGWPTSTFNGDGRPPSQIARSGHCSLVLLHDDVMTAVKSYNRT